MGVLGKGVAHGSCSLLHAVALGLGSSLALDLNVVAMVRDDEPKNPPSDPDGLLKSVVNTWKEAGHKLPADEVFWTIRSRIPPRQGLKSSAAVAVAALRALSESTKVDVEISDLIDMAGAAQLAAGVSITGSIDDAWAAATEGWKIVDPNVSASEGVLLEGDGPPSEDWTVLLIIRDDVRGEIDEGAFAWHQQGFEQALAALQEGNEIVALTCNGRSMAGVLNDPVGRRLSNDAFMNGARGAGITGSGPAVAIFVPSISQPTIERMVNMYENLKEVEKVITTTILNPVSNTEQEDE